MNTIYKHSDEMDTCLFGGEFGPNEITVTLTPEIKERINALRNLLKEANAGFEFNIEGRVDSIAMHFSGYELDEAYEGKVRYGYLLIGERWASFNFTEEWSGADYELTLDGDTLVSGEPV